MITPRTTRLFRAADLRAFHRAIVACLPGEPAAARDCAVIVPSRVRLDQLTARVTQASMQVARLVVPAETAEAHGLLKNAIQLASRAADSRLRAIAAGDMQRAWEASSAAAGALMLYQRARADQLTVMEPPATK